jgi:hypothetical protein
VGQSWKVQGKVVLLLRLYEMCTGPAVCSAGKMASLAESGEWRTCPELDDRKMSAVADRLMLSGFDLLETFPMHLAFPCLGV